MSDYLHSKTEAKVRRIVEIARELFASTGFESTGMEDIAQASGYAVGSLYYHFASKEELCGRIVLSELEDLITKLNQFQERVTGFWDTSQCFAQAYLAFYQGSFTYYEVIWQRRQKVGSELMEEIIDLHRQGMELYKKVVERGKEQGELIKDIDAGEVTAVLLALLNGVATSARYQLDAITGMNADDLVRTNLKMILSGIAARK